MRFTFVYHKFCLTCVSVGSSPFKIMNTPLCIVGFVFLGLLSSSATKETPPLVQVYSRTQGDLGKPNILLCHASNFYPPVIKLDLLKDTEVMLEANQTEMAFEDNWDYYMTKHALFTPQKGEES
ncbi:beta-2-microglobulin-like isoform X2 [Nerophis lumbriciformis]|uniref:beta-2-microglobulin-like isoform X2 n=1 Tax=Nerophis lumbriciformis TaxID=546530 RepID=UPI003BAD73A8